MADYLSPQDLANAKVDAKTLGEALNDEKVVKPRYGKSYDSFPLLVRKLLDNGGFRPFPNEQAIKDYVPTVTPSAAKDMSTYKLWLWDKGVWTDTGLSELERSIQHTDSLIQKTQKKNAWDVSDSLGKEAIAVTQDGDFKTGNTLTVQESTQFAHILARDSTGAVAAAIDKNGDLIAGKTTHKATSNTFVHSITDASGRMAIAIDKNGNQVNFSKPEASKSVDWHKADVMMCSSLGQSLSKGRNSLPIKNTLQPFNNITFAGGELSNSYDNLNLSAFKPLIGEQFNANYGESPNIWHLNKLVEKQTAKGDKPANWVFLGTAPQYGGTPFEGLNKGSKGYKEYIDQVQAAFDLCQDENKTFVVSHNTWTQGENDYSLSTSKDAYKFEQIKLKNDIADDVMRITKQKFRPVLITYQCAAHRNYVGNRNYNSIAQAQFEAAIEDSETYLACPIYNLQFHTDNVHLTSNGSQMLGYYYARVSEQVLIQKQDWMPLQPAAINWQGKVIDVVFHVPAGELEFDTELVNSAVNMGFDVWDKYDTDLMYDIISSVEITDKNRIRIILNEDAPESAILSYARGRASDGNVTSSANRPRGNLRDTAGIAENYIDTSGNTAYLHNWCVMFNIDRNFSI